MEETGRQNGKKYLDTLAVSRITGRACGTLANDRLYRKGIPYIKLGQKVLYDIEDIYDFMEKHKIRYE